MQRKLCKIFQIQVIVRVIIHEKLTILFQYKICLNLQAADFQWCSEADYGGEGTELLDDAAWSFPASELGRSQRFSEQADGSKSHSSILQPSHTTVKQFNNLCTHIYNTLNLGCSYTSYVPYLCSIGLKIFPSFNSR